MHIKEHNEQLDSMKFGYLLVFLNIFTAHSSVMPVLSLSFF